MTTETKLYTLISYQPEERDYDGDLENGANFDYQPELDAESLENNMYTRLVHRTASEGEWNFLIQHKGDALLTHGTQFDFACTPGEANSEAQAEARKRLQAAIKRADEDRRERARLILEQREAERKSYQERTEREHFHQSKSEYLRLKAKFEKEN